VIINVDAVRTKAMEFVSQLMKHPETPETVETLKHLKRETGPFPFTIQKR